MSDQLRLDELTAVGGTFSGLLFENPNTGYPLQLSWAFSVDCAEVGRDYGSTRPNVVVDWVPASDQRAWNEMAGERFACATFGEPVETSVYFFHHHRYDTVEVQVSAQRGAELAVRIRASGDIDSLGISAIAVDATLTFSGIYVQTDSSGTNVERAAELLSQFTDASGLQGRPRGHNVVFELGDDGNQQERWVCVPCRRVAFDIPGADDDVLCRECGRMCEDIGGEVRLPSRSDRRGWVYVALTLRESRPSRMQALEREAARLAAQGSGGDSHELKSVLRSLRSLVLAE